ncbi:jg16363, partial [Pararge aegeria aegeria]
PQLHPEINDQFEEVTSTTTNNTHTESTINPQLSQVTDENNEIFDDKLEAALNKSKNKEVEVKDNVFIKLYKIIKGQIVKFIKTPKINTVLRNIGTCMVNGAMEIVSYYCPAPLIPLIASAAGMVIPFDPVVMLRRRMPVTSYRRAIKTAVNSFMNTFNAYKFDNDDEDPYMTRRFNRRFMNDAPKEDTTKSNTIDDNY